MSTQDTLTETSPFDEIRYTLSKQIPSITPGVVTQTNNGDICLDDSHQKRSPVGITYILDGVFKALGYEINRNGGDLAKVEGNSNG